ncbi:nucleoside diphosphate kinase [Streptococcus pneumoniae]|nr:nucleoside diphosphate kinase [Streptococcus pneumoniae]
MEQTFFIIKPDGVKRGLVGEVLKRIEQRGFTIEKLEFRSQVSEELIDQHYQDLVGQSFYPPIREFMTSGPVLVGVISGPKVIETWRTMMGATRPEEALPGTIRGDFAKKLLEKMRLSKMLYMVQIQKSQLSEKLLFGFKSGLAQSIG